MATTTGSSLRDLMIDGVCSVKHRFEVIDDRRLHHLDYGGSGPTILLIHGVGGTAWIWHAVAPRLVQMGRVVSVDLRGFGLSQRSTEHRYSTGDHVDDLRELVGRLGAAARTTLVGFSWGALVALGLAHEAPEHVERVVLVDMPPASGMSAGAVRPLPFRHATHREAVAAERAVAPRAETEVLERTVSLLTVPAADGTAALVRAIDPWFLECWPFLEDDLWFELAAIRAPILVVRGAESPVLDPATAERMIGAAYDARLVTIPDCGHLVPVEQPAPLAAALTTFLGTA